MMILDGRATVLHTRLGEVQVGREGSGPPVLAIHGGPGGFDQGLAWCRHLRDGGCEVIAPSRPGYLRTPLASGPTCEAQADLYAAVLDAVEVPRAVVLGASSGGPSAVHFAARHPDRTVALFLDAAILLPFVPGVSRLRKATYESAPLVWLAYQLVTRWPHRMVRFMVDGVSHGLDEAQRAAEIAWIAEHPGRLHGMQEQFMSIAPKAYRHVGWVNDQANEANLAPLPFSDVHAPTLVAIGANEAIVPRDHALHAFDRIAGAELLIVPGGHHLLSLSSNYGSVARRQLELAGA